MEFEQLDTNRHASRSRPQVRVDCPITLSAGALDQESKLSSKQSKTGTTAASLAGTLDISQNRGDSIAVSAEDRARRARFIDNPAAIGP
jgi:hypothetical protein